MSKKLCQEGEGAKRYESNGLLHLPFRGATREEAHAEKHETEKEKRLSSFGMNGRPWMENDRCRGQPIYRRISCTWWTICSMRGASGPCSITVNMAGKNALSGKSATLTQTGIQSAPCLVFHTPPPVYFPRVI